MEVSLSPSADKPMQVVVASPQGMTLSEVGLALYYGYSRMGVVVTIEYGAGLHANGVPVGTVVVTKERS